VLLSVDDSSVVVGKLFGGDHPTTRGRYFLWLNPLFPRVAYILVTFSLPLIEQPLIGLVNV
jgi:hypothetical protein